MKVNKETGFLEYLIIFNCAIVFYKLGSWMVWLMTERKGAES